ncbi:unnamed protein product [Clonostachys rosea f. rosea IK726]|uniref:Uncharacterized protein n=2 Tax=Bionectria ochroleuca TaxID=29856 RepID=A0A8H7TTP3_BIOOC|nr:unnamed protein product [Clonostachys rosea f. rosea IK726]
MTLKKGPRDQTVRPRTLTLGRAMRPDHQNNRPKGKVSVRMGKTGERTGRKAAAELRAATPDYARLDSEIGCELACGVESAVRRRARYGDVRPRTLAPDAD